MLEQIDWVGGKAIKTEMDSRLEELETTIAKELKAFYRVGNALAEIRDNRLYRLKGYKSFEAYCVEEWEMHRQHAHRLINASAVVKNLYPVGNKLPENEAQVRPLVGLSPEKQREVWQAVCESDKPVTAERVQAVVENPLISQVEIRQAVCESDKPVTAERVQAVVENPLSQVEVIKERYALLKASNTLIDLKKKELNEEILKKMVFIRKQIEALNELVEQAVEKQQEKKGFYLNRAYKLNSKDGKGSAITYIEEFTEQGAVISYVSSGVFRTEEVSLRCLKEICK